jgi:N4-gp56 family major capsid protein
LANAYTGTAAVSNVVQTAYDRMVEFALRSQPLFRQVADKKPAQQAMPGSSVVLELYQDLAQVASTLTETVDPDAVAIGNPTTVSITLNEYGNTVLQTRLLNLFSFTDVAPAITNQVAYNMANSIDLVVQNVLRAGITNIIQENAGALFTSGGTTTNIAAGDVFKSRDVRAAVALLRTNQAVPKKGSLYYCAIHPEVSYDLRSELSGGSGGSASWRDPHAYSAPGSIWAGEIGEYEGAYFVETPRAYSAQAGAGAGGTQVRVFNTYVLGQQALAEALSEEFHVVFGPVVDKLMRFRPVGWYGVAGWSIYRTAASQMIQTSATLRPNV